MKDYYKTLGVGKSADEKTIKKAYRKLVKEYHPDHTSGDKKKRAIFFNVQEAYETLGDKVKRAEYDKQMNETQRSYTGSTSQSTTTQRTKAKPFNTDNLEEAMVDLQDTYDEIQKMKEELRESSSVHRVGKSLGDILKEGAQTGYAALWGAYHRYKNR